MEPCYKYLGCREKDCIMCGREDERHCWEVDHTSCNHSGIQQARDAHPELSKKEVCERSQCIYFQAVKERGLV